MTFIKKEHAKNLILQESQKHIGFEWLYKSVYDRVSKCAEVEAIPIEWIVKWLDKTNRHYCDVDLMLEEWEAEHDIN